MAASHSKQPMNWDEDGNEGSPGRISFISGTDQVHIDRSSPSSASGHLNIPRQKQRQESGSSDLEQDLRRRRSSISMRVNSLRQIGGVNSIENFARSWQRAAGFYEITPIRTSSRTSFAEEQDEQGQSSYPDDEQEPQQRQQTPREYRSLLHEQLRGHGMRPESTSQDNVPSQGGADSEYHTAGGARSFAPRQAADEHEEEIVSHTPLLASAYGGSYGASFGTLTSRVNESSMRHAERLFHGQQVAGAQEPDKEREPLLVKRVTREDGHVVNVVVGQSTLPQTVFNSVNVLVGVGLLSLPLGMKYAGWLIGLLFLSFAAITTAYTARILAKCLDVDDALITFADLAYASFGHRARIATSVIFCVELMTTCVALVVLFGDAFDALIPGFGVIGWKIVCGIIVIPLNFLPLRILSFSSALGILCSLGIVVVVFVDGLVKPHNPGSLREPAMNNILPRDWMTIPLSFGMIMSPWGGHGVFPNIYRDMRHPHKYGKALRVTYSSTYCLDLSMAIIGYLMFGEGLKEEVTSNIFLTKGYPHALSVCLVIFIAIIPLSKIPLNARPIVSTIEIFSSLDARAVSSSSPLIGMSGLTRGILKFTIRIGTTIVLVVLAIVFPAFDRIMALSGSAMCFTICIILPLAFYLKIFGRDISFRERMLDWALLIVCSIMALVGTVWAFLPKAMVGAASK